MSEKRSKYSLLGRINFEDLYNAFLGFEQRQQMLIVAVCFVVLILILVLPISCASSRLNRLEEDYKKTRGGMEDLSTKIRDYQVSQARLEGVKKKLAATENESLTTVLETIANEEGIGQNVEKLKPINLETNDYYDEIGVDASLSKVTLEQTVNYLYKLENHPNLSMKIKKLQIKPRYDNRQLLNVTLQVAAIKLKGETSE